MKVIESENKILPEDIMIAAVTNEVTEDYVYKILSGNREANSKKARQIISTLNKLANINKSTAKKKSTILNKNQA